jgi:hypothetical protein
MDIGVPGALEVLNEIVIARLIGIDYADQFTESQVRNNKGQVFLRESTSRVSAKRILTGLG